MHPRDTSVPEMQACERLLKDFDWTTSPLGPREGWPVELRTLTGVMMGSLQPMLVVWGPERIVIYNDGYAAMCGDRHPQGFGRPFFEMWHDVRERIRPNIDAAFGGRGISMTDSAITLSRNGRSEEAHFAFSYTPVRDPWGKVLGLFCACVETTAEVARQKAEADQRERLAQVFQLSPSGIAMLVGPDHVFDYANEAYFRIIGNNRDIIGRPVHEAVPEAVRQGYIQLLDKVFLTGEPFVAQNLSIELARGPSGEAETRVIDISYQAMRDTMGQINGVLAQVQDVTERAAEDKRRDAISHELGHRLKNQLAMVQAIASQTLRSATDLASARKSLTARIAVLGHAHDTVVQGGGGPGMIADLVARTIAVHDDPLAPRIEAEGPPVPIGARPTLSLSLILHELATNAVKYGALSGRTGRVSIRWAIEGDRIVILWRETGGPLVVAPAVEGSGSRLIRAGLAGTKECEVVIDHRPDGLECRITADLASFSAD